MKKIIIFLLILSIAFFPIIRSSPSEKLANNLPLLSALELYYAKPEGSLRIMTFNLLSHEIGFDGINHPTRQGNIIALINAISPDILALQEMSSSLLSVLKNETFLSFTDPLPYALSRTMTTLMYNPRSLRLLRHGTASYHYSTNPRLRCYTWGLFEAHTTHKKFMVVNTHLNLYEQATAYPILQATELISFCRSAQERYDCPIFISGDFNSTKGSSESFSTVFDYVSLFYTSTLSSAQVRSYGGDKSALAPSNDYIFASSEAPVLFYCLLSQPELNTLSDHYPIFIDVNIHLESVYK